MQEGPKINWENREKLARRERQPGGLKLLNNNPYPTDENKIPSTLVDTRGSLVEDCDRA
jgi:hypothetical protein